MSDYNRPDTGRDNPLLTVLEEVLAARLEPHNPAGGYEYRQTLIETADACDEGSSSVVDYELSPDELRELIAALKSRSYAPQGADIGLQRVKDSTQDGICVAHSPGSTTTRPDGGAISPEKTCQGEGRHPSPAHPQPNDSHGENAAANPDCPPSLEEGRTGVTGRRDGQPNLGHAVGTIPDGWKLVPVEPTKRMTCEAFIRATEVAPDGWSLGSADSQEFFGAIYRHMLKTSPEPVLSQVPKQEPTT